jgi:FixJ family two-component response regulator
MSQDIQILFVDDEKNILKAMRRLFSKKQWKADFAQSAREALQLFEKKGPYDIIITDQKMPEMTGLELLQKLRYAYPETIRIVLTGYADVTTVLDARNQGYVYKFFTKPWDDDVLLKTVRDVAEAMQLRRQNRRLTAQVKAQTEEISAIDWLITELDSCQADPSTSGDFRGVLEALPVAVVVVGMDGNVALANSEASRILGGQDSEELAGRPFSLERLQEHQSLGWREAELPLISGGTGTVFVFWELEEGFRAKDPTEQMSGGQAFVSNGLK